MKKKVITNIRKNKYKILVCLILIIGFAVRLVGIQNHPNGMNVDETSSGYEAYSILNYGIDRNGKIMPVFLISWGSGQNALYSYMIIPFVKLFGLSTLTTRLPMAILGCISLIIFYKMLELIKGKKLALIGLTFCTICPWHIMKSRWGLESNVFPDLTLIAVFIIMQALKNKKIYLMYIGFVVLGLCAYAYGTSYFFLPLFVIPLLIYLILKKQINWKQAIFCLLIVFIVSLPIILFVIINTFDLPEIKIGIFTVPRTTSNRYESITTLFEGNIIFNSLKNFLKSLSILVTQYDGLGWNAFKFYGLTYVFSLPFTIIGIAKNFEESGSQKSETAEKIKNKNQKKLKYSNNTKIYKNMINIWFIVAVLLLFVCEPNINRINIIMIPLIYYTALGIYEITKISKLISIIIAIIYLLSFGMFINKYWNTDFSEFNVFNDGLDEVYEYIQEKNPNTVYIEYSYKEPYIYTLFYTKENPHNFVDSVEYKSPDGFERVKAYGKYKYYLPDEIKPEDGTIYVIKKDNDNLKEKINENEFNIKEFEKYIILENK